MRALHTDAVGVELIRSHARGLAALADDGALDEPVPTCGDWLLADLVWHLMEVQDFWAYIIANRPSGPDAYVQCPRPPTNELADGLRSAGDRLASALRGVDPSEEAWSWSDDQTVGFSVRRQTHEALVHHVDGLLALGLAVPSMDQRLGADGVDEVVNVMLGESFPGEEFGGTVVLVATDIDDNWVIGTVGDNADAVVSCTALELDLWLWGRGKLPASAVKGDHTLPDRLREAVTIATQ